MTKEDRLAIIGFHVAALNVCYDQIKSIKVNMKHDPDFKDHGDLECLDTELGLHIELANCAMKGSWICYANLVNVHNLKADEIPDTLRYNQVIKQSINVLRNKPNKRRPKNG